MTDATHPKCSCQSPKFWADNPGYCFKCWGQIPATHRVRNVLWAPRFSWVEVAVIYVVAQAITLRIS